MIIAELKLTHRPLDTKRIRRIDNWYITSTPHGYVINGIVRTDSEVDFDSNIPRFTSTSPIIGRRGNNILITESKSEYTLLTENPRNEISLTIFEEIQ